MATLNNLKIGDYLQGQHSKLVYKIINIQYEFTTIQDIKSLREYSVNPKYLYSYNKIEMENKKMFTKEGFETGDVIVRRNGDVEILLKEKQMFIRNDGGWNSLWSLNDNLECNHSFFNNEEKAWDIMKVFRSNSIHQISFKKYNNGKLVFDRERDVQKEVKMSISEIEKKLGIKNLKIVKED